MVDNILIIMKRKLFSLLLNCLTISFLWSQQLPFAATMDAADAQKIAKIFPSEVNILGIKDQEAAVLMSESAAHYLHKNVLVHGPGFVFQPSAKKALSTIARPKIKASKILDLTITEDALVTEALPLVDANLIKNHIQILQNYGTRRHDTPTALTSVNDLKNKWETMIANSGRTDVSVRLVNHPNTPMPSLVLTFIGKNEPSDFVIVGAHMDSISNVAAAPGADDDASGIACITEMIRVLLALNFQPAKTMEFMAYAGEEVGLRGSHDIADQYFANGVNVIAYVQFDMTNYKGSPEDIYITDDVYNSYDLNLYLMELIEHYNSSGSHLMTYGTTTCSYGCSDHFSWAINGYHAAFPFEASFSGGNPRIHTAFDTLENMDTTANHASKFAKLGLEFLIETSKSALLSTEGNIKKDFNAFLIGESLAFHSSEEILQLQILDSSARIIAQKQNLGKNNTIDLNAIKAGFYLGVFKGKNGKIYTHKFLKP